MDPLHSSKVSIPGRILGLVLKTGWYKSKFKKTVMGLFLLLHLGNCITTISVPQASSPITVKSDACLSCGVPKNQHYIPLPHPIPIKLITLANTAILHALVGVLGGWTTDPKGSAAQMASWFSGCTSHPFWKHILPKMQICRASPPPNCQHLQCNPLILIINDSSFMSSHLSSENKG
jgi:hypothetical protein